MTLVSGAAGAVGQVVSQVAVREGLYVCITRNTFEDSSAKLTLFSQVIGSVGDDKKLGFIINKLGSHAGFNYKKEHLTEVVKRFAPNGLDI